MGCNIAIDGPAGAGKSTIAKKVAKELSCGYRSHVQSHGVLSAEPGHQRR